MGLKEKDEVIVSIFMITYNHEKYIKEAIESILEQKTNFVYELVIGEDCSIDNTREILKEYQKEYPDKIKLILHDSNIGVIPNMLATFRACRGKYIAMCEGDDFWTDPLKLQTQVDFLENNLEYNMCFTSSENYNQTTGEVVEQFPDSFQDKDYTLNDIFKSNMGNTCTVMYRNLNIEIPSVFNTFSLGDWPLHMLYAERGKVKYIGKSMARYRIHPGGIWSQDKVVNNLRHVIDMLLGMNTYFERKYEKEIHTSISKYLLILAFKYMKAKDIRNFVGTYNKSKKFGSTSMREIIILFMDCCFQDILKHLFNLKQKLLKRKRKHGESNND